MEVVGLSKHFVENHILMQSLSLIWQDVCAAVNTNDITLASSVYKLILSMVLGACVGYQRKRRGQTAGVRTFALISMGATLAMILSVYVPTVYYGLKNGDPSRIAAQVVTGIGFLGAGAIIQMKGSVRGLTTAAGIWMVSAIGMAVGMGMYWLSFIATMLILFILVQLERVERHMHLGVDSRVVRLRLGTIVEDIEPYRKVLGDHGVRLQHYYIQYDYSNNLTRLDLVVLMRDDTDMITIFKHLREVYPTDAIVLATEINI